MGDEHPHITIDTNIRNYDNSEDINEELSLDNQEAGKYSLPKSSEVMTSTRAEPESWLLRLFESDFFDSRLAVSYLFKYPKNVGIHHYICRELKKFPESEIRFLLPQLCHIMVSRPLESAALEDLIISLCQSSHHMAILSLWYLESYLNDMHQASSTHTESYSLCKRLYLACQAIVFSETTTPSQDLMSDLLDFDVQKSAHIPPTIVGIGLLLSSVAAPIAHKTAESLVATQSKKPRFYNPIGDSHTEFHDEVASDAESMNTVDTHKVEKRKKIWDRIIPRIPTCSPSLDELSNGAAFSFTNFLEKTKKRRDEYTGKSSSVLELEQDDALPLSSSKITHSESFLCKDVVPDHIHDKLHRSHYFHSEMQFIMTLVDISERLVSVPKAARQSSLIAELSLLNHNLPAYVCIPFCCPAASSDTSHHQVARIALSDCVVLNSADRVPFLMIVEVIETDANHPGKGTRSIAHIKTPQCDAISPKRLSISKSPTRSTGPTSATRDSADYHIHLMSRRQSVIKAISPQSRKNHEEISEEDIPEDTVDIALLKPKTRPFESKLGAPRRSFSLSAKQEDSYVSMPISARSSDEDWEDEGPSVKIPIHSDDDAAFADKMRTAAVLLAQLYQQQQKEAAKVNIKQRSRTRSRSSSITSSNSEMFGKSTSATTSSPATDKRTQQKRKTEFETIRNRVLQEMSATEDERLNHLNSSKGKKSIASRRVDEILADFEETGAERDSEDPSASVFRETWEKKKERIRAESPYGSHKNWQLYSVIVKSGADLRQEQLALQLITEMKRIWDFFKIPLWVYPFSILITSDRSGLIEVIPDSISIHSIKKNGYAQKLNQPGIAFTIYDHFVKEFCQPGSNEFQIAQDNFLSSLAGYSLISYLLQLKDRHNGNILLDRQGHITHIDFGFMLMNSPGSVGFELAPFKMPQEYIDVLGGIGSEKFEDFRELMKLGFLALRKRSETLLSMVEIMEKESRLPCFTGVNKPASSPDARNVRGATPVTQGLRDRLQLGLTDDACSEFIDGLINSSCNNTFTSLYDSFQFYANGIL